MKVLAKRLREHAGMRLDPVFVAAAFPVTVGYLE